MSSFLGLGPARSSLRTALGAATRRAPTLLETRCVRCFATARQGSSSSSSSSSRQLRSPLRPRLLHGPAAAQLTTLHQCIQTRGIFSSGVIKDYVDLPPDYEDAHGLDFAKKPLDDHEVLMIFGHGMDTISANRLLQILHGRRVAGTLDDPALQRHTILYSKQQQDAALAYLRKTVPVNELVNAGLRAEDELAELEAAAVGEELPKEKQQLSAKELAAEANWRRRLYKERPKQDELEAAAAGEELPKEKQQLSAKELAAEANWRRRLYKERPKQDELYGRGSFDKIRARNELKYEEELRRQEEEKRKREEEEARQNPGKLQKIDETAPRELSPRMKEWHVAATSTLKEPPKMSKWQRLWPSYAVILSLIGAGAVLSMYYTPPKRSQRLFPDVPPAAATVLTLMAANVAVWALWKVPPAWRVMNRYFLLVAATPQPLSIVGTMLSHQKIGHLAVNMLFLWFFGTRLHDEVGRANFLEVYFASGTLGFLASLTGMVLRGNLHLTTLGASGAIYGVATAYFMLHRYEGFKVFGLPPDPYGGIQGLGFIGLMLGINIMSLMSKKQVLDVASHVAGMAAGAAYSEYVRRKMGDRKGGDKKARPETTTTTTTLGGGDREPPGALERVVAEK
ncbi:uncharacterized protein E0L32_003639 [Thyridium curvatum]|uniref:Peptidase S54 rhomboid domain-containing protein n=1 Tax=Thyridium curvatum TaxID=1093900 RepID=A0A507BJ61_9PEZI|nr:uncharacterized protein E0L32_003639 [Thyridium curvatum]TPX16698.1 hypothetical protein E0L32_003639 [Thyridium curvatum]